METKAIILASEGYLDYIKFHIFNSPLVS